MKYTIAFYESEMHPSRINQQLSVQAAQVGGITLSLGLVFWVLRVNNLLIWFLGSLPMWRFYDPLPVLDMTRKEKSVRDKKVERMDYDENDIELFLESEEIEEKRRINKMRISPVIRITIGLVALSIGLVLIGDFLFELYSSRAGDLFKKRKELIESLVMKYSTLILNDEFDAMIEEMNQLLNNNQEIVSLALKDRKGDPMVVSGDHHQHWVALPKGASRLHQIQVPIYKKNLFWGKLEVQFKEPKFTEQLLMLASPLLKLLLFMMFAGFFIYFFYMKRVLFYLDPSAVIPDRVKSAMDILAEAVLFLDAKGKILLANASFTEKSGIEDKMLLGKSIISIDWYDPITKKAMAHFPYLKDFLKGTPIRRKSIALSSVKGKIHKMVMNSSAILDPKGNLKGVLVSLDDVTELEAANQKLTVLAQNLNKSNEKIERQNEKLTHLATRDPLTGCFNRRILFQLLEKEFNEAKENGSELCCIMTDIDKFKVFNDTYGHALGDRVIQIVAKLLGQGLRSRDFVARYSGEEFCLVIVGATIEQTAAIADRTRLLLEKEGGRRLRTEEEIKITSSFGVSSINSRAKDPADLIDQSDKALYMAKERGRNRVECFDTQNIKSKEVSP